MRIMRAFAHALAVLSMIAAASCGMVTETGNPTQAGGETFAPTDAGDNTYINEPLGVLIRYPDGWTLVNGVLEAGETGETVLEFQSGDHDDGTTTATITIAILDPPPLTLFGYLFETYPGLSFMPYGTSTLAGYVYDDPDAGPALGDLREYFFLHMDILVRVEAEIFPSTESEFMALLEGIAFL